MSETKKLIKKVKKMEQTRATSASFSGQLPNTDRLEDSQGRMPRSNSTGDVRAVEVLPTVTQAKQQIGTAFGIGTSELAEGPSSLKDGQALLNQDFSRWELSATAAKTNTTYNGFAKTILVGLKSILNYVSWASITIETNAR